MTSTAGDLRQRLARGFQGQSALQGVRLIVQVGSVAVLAGTWGAQLFGEWLILFALPAYLQVTDLGLFAAAGNDMVMKVSRGDHQGARRVFQAASIAVTLMFVAIAVLVLGVAVAAPMSDWLNLEVISESSATWILLVFSVNTFFFAYGGIMYGSFASVGRYGEATFALAGIALLEFGGLATAVLLDAEPLVAAASMLGGRAVGTVVMYGALRRQVPWLWLGLPPRVFAPLRPLVGPGLGSAAFLGALALNVQGVVVLLGAVLGPASVAVFSTVRTMSRSVVQILGAVIAVITPELSRAYAEESPDRLRRIHRGGCQATAWLSIPMLAVLAVFGTEIVRIWTSETIDPGTAELYLLLGVAGVAALWTTSFSVIYARNQHQRLSVIYLLASAAALPLAYVLAEAMGIEGAALAILALESLMLVATLRQSLPAAHDNLAGWAAAMMRPPPFRWLLRRTPSPT